MQVAAFVVQLLIIVLGTLGVVQFDRKRRPAQLNDPSMNSVLLVAVLFNVVCLPYYFARTRGGWKGVAMGIGAMLGVYGVAVAASMVVAVIGGAVG